MRTTSISTRRGCCETRRTGVRVRPRGHVPATVPNNSPMARGHKAWDGPRALRKRHVGLAFEDPPEKDPSSVALGIAEDHAWRGILDDATMLHEYDTI